MIGQQTKRTEPIRVPVKPCCGEVLAGEDCNCGDVAVSLAEAIDREATEGVVRIKAGGGAR